MNEHLRDRILRKLEALSDERGYQVLDYVEFLESKYAERQAPATSIFTRFSEAVEDRLRAGKISATAIAETMGLMNRAMNVLNGVATGVAAAGRSVASDFERATSSRGTPAGGTPASGAAASGAAPAGTTPGGAQAAGGSTDRAAASGPAARPSGAPVAGKGTGSDESAAPAPSQSAAPPSPNDPSATESGELEPPVDR
jgi:hypothetical protein